MKAHGWQDGPGKKTMGTLPEFEYISRHAVAESGVHDLVLRDEHFTTHIVNLQLQYWMDAVHLYRALRKRQIVTVQSLRPVFLLSGQSLTTLFGMHHPASKKTPYLREIVDSYLVKQGLDLKREVPKLYERFKHFNTVYNDLIKHPSNGKWPQISQLTMGDLADTMETVQELWRWFLEGLGFDEVHYGKYLSFTFR